VVGGGVFPDGVVDSDILIAELAERIGFSVKRILAVNKRVATTKRVIKRGEARESIIIMQKEGGQHQEPANYKYSLTTRMEVP